MMDETGKMLDIVTIGESMLRLTPPPPQALEQSPYFEVRVGGSEMNLAITAARMGLHTAWISKLPNNPLGRRVARSAQEHGVNTGQVVWSSEGRVGVYFIESGESPRRRDTYYDRADSTFTTLAPEEVDWAYVRSGRLFHFSGITLALGDLPRRVVRRALEQAAGTDQLVSFDLNYRAKLWSAAEARKAVEAVLPAVDIFCSGLEDARAVLGVAGEASEAAQQLFERYSPQVAIITDEARVAAAFDGRLHTRTPRPVQVVDRIGAGDAFMGGFLVGFLEGGVKLGLEMGTALGALKLTYLGDVPWCTRAEVLAFMDDRQSPTR